MRIEREATDNVILSERLSVPGFFSTTDSERTRTVALLMQMGGWTLNGRTFEMTGVTNDETIQLNAIETWEFTNDSASGGMGMGMPLGIHEDDAVGLLDGGLDLDLPRLRFFRAAGRCNRRRTATR